MTRRPRHLYLVDPGVPVYELRPAAGQYEHWRPSRPPLYLVASRRVKLIASEIVGLISRATAAVLLAAAALLVALTYGGADTTSGPTAGATVAARPCPDQPPPTRLSDQLVVADTGCRQ